MCSVTRVTMASFRPRLQSLDSQPPSMPGRFDRFEAALGSLERKANVGMPNERHFARNLTGRDSNKRQLTIPWLAAIKRFLVWRASGSRPISKDKIVHDFWKESTFSTEGKLDIYISNIKWEKSVKNYNYLNSFKFNVVHKQHNILFIK